MTMSHETETHDPEIGTTWKAISREQPSHSELAVAEILQACAGMSTDSLRKWCRLFLEVLSEKGLVSDEAVERALSQVTNHSLPTALPE